MGVNKGIVLFLFTLLYLKGFTQSQVNISFKEKPLPEAIQLVVESFDLYVSYNPKIFKDQPPVSLDVKAYSIQEALDQILGNRFSFKVINDYVVINSKKQPEEITPLLSTAEQKPVVYDTIIIEKTDIHFDTVRVEVLEKKEVYDTIFTEKQVKVYDTVTYHVKPKNNHQFLSYVAPTLWRRDSESLFGAAVGLSYRYNLPDFYVELGVSYQYAMHNVNFSEEEILTELQVDTLSTFFVIENGQRTPVYVIDSTFSDREVTTEVDRTNSVHQISLALLVGKSFRVSNRIELGVNTGFSVDWVFRTDELLRVDNNLSERSLEPPNYRFPLQNIRIELPFLYKGNSLSEGYFLSPFGEVGLNSDFQANGSSANRYRFGIKIGVFF
ncbi:MAG: STN domain-containing protein [Bacteroidota bacterium]